LQSDEEDGVKKGIILAFGTLLLLAGCGSSGNNAAKAPVEPKWKGLPYRLAVDTKATKPNPAGVTIPGILYTANPEDLETRAILVVRFDGADDAKTAPIGGRMIMAPEDIHGAEGALAADYMDRANKQLADFLASYCVKGKVKVSVALVRSSINPHADDAEVAAKRLSDWLPVEVVFKNPHPKC
jgi:hypothetical protein